jgi:acyl dehydratase
LTIRFGRPNQNARVAPGCSGAASFRGHVASSGLITDMEGVRHPAGRRLGHTEWLEMSQDQVDRFAEVTGDHTVRFPSPLPVGAYWRGSAEIAEVTDIKDGVQVKLVPTIEVSDSERPAVVTECLVRFYA